MYDAQKIKILCVKLRHEMVKSENSRVRWIAEAFNKSGLNPWGDDTGSLKHLNLLKDVGMSMA